MVLPRQLPVSNEDIDMDDGEGRVGDFPYPRLFGTQPRVFHVPTEEEVSELSDSSSGASEGDESSGFTLYPEDLAESGGVAAEDLGTIYIESYWTLRFFDLLDECEKKYPQIFKEFENLYFECYATKLNQSAFLEFRKKLIARVRQPITNLQ